MEKIKINLSSTPPLAGHSCRWERHPNLHHLEICSRDECGRVRAVPFNWNAQDEMEAAFMGRQEEMLQQQRAAQMRGL